MDAPTLKRAASAVTMGLGGLLWLAAILFMAQTAQNSEQFSRLHPWILAINIAGLAVLVGLLATELTQSPEIAWAEPDRIGTPRILAVGAASLIVFAAASWVTILYGYDRTRAEVLPDGPAAQPSEIGRNKIGIVEQRLFSLAAEPAEWRQQQVKRLHSFGWVDRKTGVVHVPIGDAMARVARGERP